MQNLARTAKTLHC